jgi:hypothetical protein
MVVTLLYSVDQQLSIHGTDQSSTEQKADVAHQFGDAQQSTGWSFLHMKCHVALQDLAIAIPTVVLCNHAWFLTAFVQPSFIMDKYTMCSSIWFSIKVLFFPFVYIWVRAAFPRYRYDQLMRLTFIIRALRWNS